MAVFVTREITYFSGRKFHRDKISQRLRRAKINFAGINIREWSKYWHFLISKPNFVVCLQMFCELTQKYDFTCINSRNRKTLYQYCIWTTNRALNSGKRSRILIWSHIKTKNYYTKSTKSSHISFNILQSISDISRYLFLTHSEN